MDSHLPTTVRTLTPQIHGTGLNNYVPATDQGALYVGEQRARPRGTVVSSPSALLFSALLKQSSLRFCLRP
eukprot:353069-Chlamydomonas_euryale.AAC.19